MLLNQLQLSLFSCYIFVPVLFIFSSSQLLSEDKNLHELWELAQSNSSELKVFRSKYRAVRAKNTTAGISEIHNPELEFQIKNGNRKETPVLDSAGSLSVDRGSQKVSGWEAGISQKLNAPGKRNFQKEIASVRENSMMDEYKYELLSAKAKLRHHHYNMLLQLEMSSHLQEHIDYLNLIKQQFGRGYRDSKLGTSVITAIEMDLTRFHAEKIAIDSSYEESLMMIKEMTASSPKKLFKLDHVNIFSDLPEYSALLIKMRNEGPMLKLIENRIRIADLENKYSNRAALPDPTLFASAGNEKIGNPGASFDILNPASENESYVRAGIKIPLPVFSRNQKNRADSLEGKYNASLEKEMYDRKAEIRLNFLYRQFASIKDLVARNHKIDKISETYIQQLSSALLNRRITYFDFIGELERQHELINLEHKSILELLGVLGELEIMTGMDLDGLQSRNLDEFISDREIK